MWAEGGTASGWTHLLRGGVQQAQVCGCGVHQPASFQVLHAAMEGPVEAIHEAASKAAGWLTYMCLELMPRHMILYNVDVRQYNMLDVVCVMR